MMLNRRLVLTGSASAAALAALAACSSSGSGGSGSATGGASAAGLAASDLNERARDELAQGGTLTVPIDAFVGNFNVMHLDGNTVANASIQSFCGVVNWIYADDASFEARTEFCEDYSEEIADDKTVVTMHLNPAAVWASGDPITVADYQACWKACNGTDEAFTAVVASTSGWEHIESIEQGADEYEMVTTFDAVYPDWSSVLGGGIVPASRAADVETFSAWTDASDTAGWTGPYVVTAADQGKQTITLEPNPSWWGDAPLLDSVVLKVVDASARGQAFANKEIDVVDDIADASTYQQCEQRADGEIRQARGLDWRHFTINGSTGLLADQKLRQAIVKGIDRDTIAEADLQGLPVAASELRLGNHLFMPSQTGYQDNSTPLALDKEKAASELDALGWTLPDGKEYREKDGRTLSLKYLRMPSATTSATQGKVLQASMKEIGVEIVMDDTNSDDFFPERIYKGNFEIASFGWTGTPYPMAWIGMIYGKDSASNFAQVWSDELEALIDQVAVEADPDKRIELGNEADAAIWDLAAVIPLYVRADYTAVPRTLANYGSFGLSSVRPEDIGYAE